MHNLSIKSVLLFSFITSSILLGAACQRAESAGGNAADVAASVNGKPIKNQEVERILKQQFQGQESKLSPLELAQARLQTLESLIQQEVMYQRAEREKTLPTEEEITQAINQQKQQSGLSADEFNKRMQDADMNDQNLRELAKRQLAIRKLGDKVASSVEPPKDSEIDAFYKGNPEYFVKKRGATFKAIVLDPQSSGDADATKNAQEVQLRLGEIANKLKQGATFEALAAEYSEDPNTKVRSGDWRDFSEDEMKQLLGDSFADYVMNKAQVGQIVPQAVPLEGKSYILKIAAKQEKDENLTLESPNIKPQIIDLLTNAKKQLLTQAFQARAMDEARIENYLAKRVVDNPNDLSGARPYDPNAVASPSPTASPAATASPATAARANAAASPARK